MSSSLIDQLKKTCFELKNVWKNPTMLAINQAEQHVKGLEEMIDHAPEFQKASPSELLKTVGYELWNLCVEQSKKKLGNSKYESSMKFQLVRVRRVACYVIEKSIKPSLQTLKTTHDMIRLYTKTARDYIVLSKSNDVNIKNSQVDEEGDVQFVDANSQQQVGNTQQNEHVDDQFSLDCFNRAANQAELFLKLLGQEGDSNDLDKSTETALSNILTLYVDRAESHFQIGDSAAAYSNIQAAKRLVEKLPHEIQRISMIEYNYAVDLNSKERYEDAIRWLKDSFELYELDENKNLQKQSRTLRLLSNAYLESKMFDQGLNCVQIANNMFKTPQGIFLEVRLFAKLNREEEVERTIQELLRNPETPLNLSVSALKDIVEQGFNKVAFKCYKKLLEAANGSEQEPRVLVRYFDFLANHCSGDLNQDDMLKIIDRMIHLSQSSSSNITIIKESLKELECILWNIAWKHYQKKEYPQAIVFYNHSLKILPMDEMIDRAKVLRSIARCYLDDKQLTEACKAAENAEQLDPKSLHSHYLMYQISIKENNISHAKNYLKKMMHDEEFKNSFLAISAHDAYKENIYDVAIVALEALMEEEQSSNTMSLEISQILRTLTYLSTLIKDKQKVLKYLQLTKDFLNKENVSFFREEDMEAEIEWFHRVAWNHGGESVNEADYESSFQFYSLASVFYNYRTANLETFSTQKYCYLMKIHCVIEEVKSSEEYVNGEELSLKNREKLQLMLDEIQNCKKLLSKISEKESGGLEKKPDKVYTLLYLAELQILVMLKCDEVLIMDVVSSTSKLDGIIGPNIFEAMSSICLSNEKQVYYQSAKHSLQTALRKAMHNSSPNYNKVVHLFTSLIQICRTREESMSFFEELFKLLNQIKPNDHFLKSEQKHFVWLCTESWNNGVYYYK
ncbi:predicted protein [Naegleria gruberi]|uniref:Protein ZIP4 homolog n=1 Tax=Naegleria gruberi TaxID=5762 RepID=D2V4J3_NAEGR|nr:uncharacterized protein NAEGRDRAFT_63750 [Naegleria gruberi]EFC48396.1 predicted protein [Naegleria gruberi]|eukprot:XP_002681140.1 predicted protein [Naegleria gruberi strain NEG-M]